MKLLFFVLFFSSQLFAAQKKAYFAGGCFWCVEQAFEDVAGVLEAKSGYTGGNKENPTYEEVSHEKTGHQEAVEVTYDDSKVTYEKLLNVFWKNVDPFDSRGQFCDKGESYLSGIFYLTNEEKELAEKSKKAIEEKFKGKTVQTFIKQASTFYPAEDYHQDYYKKNPLRYKFYKFNCGRQKRLDEIWEK